MKDKLEQKEEKISCCGNCKHWIRHVGDENVLYGKCFYTVKFPASAYSVSHGFHRDMRSDMGRDCECYERR